MNFATPTPEDFYRVMPELLWCGFGILLMLMQSLTKNRPILTTQKSLRRKLTVISQQVERGVIVQHANVAAQPQAAGNLGAALRARNFRRGIGRGA